VLVITGILFGLGLLGLHWREKDLQAATAAEKDKGAPSVVAPADDSELAKV
jgi:hypothetical protein